MKQKVFFIVNARIGESKIETLQKAINKYFGQFEVAIKLTQYGGHATELAKEAIALHVNIIVAVGGDGTVNEVIQPLGKTQIKLGIIPTGSGNGLARHLGSSLDIEEAVKDLITAETVAIDLGIANGIYFISNAGVGFDALVCNAIKSSKFRGLKMYILEVMKHYFTYESCTYKIKTEDQFFEQKAFFLNIANGREFGYGFKIAPSANLQDGILDVVMIEKINFWNGFGIVIDGFKGNLEKNKNCKHFKCKEIEIRSTQIPYFQTDGDAHDNLNPICKIQVVPQSLMILIPSSKKNEKI